MEKSEFKRYSVLGQLFAWLLLFSIMFLDALGDDLITNAFMYAINFVVVQMALVYLHYHFVLPFFKKGKKVLFFTLSLGSVLLFSNILIASDALLPYDYPDLTEVETYWDIFSYAFPISVLLVGASSIYSFVDAWYHNTKKENALKSEKLQAELNFLKSQINPHFLFNTLNNIYSYVQTDNEKSAPMIERLSSVLRFMVYDCTEDKVMLSKEIQAIDDLLEIYRMKNSSQQNIRLKVEGVKGYHLIAPLILVNLVENACKHSDVIGNLDGFVNVTIKVNERGVCSSEISNSIKANKQPKGKYGGLGLNNIVQRLDLQYDDAYEMSHRVEKSTYHLSLNIPLDRK